MSYIIVYYITKKLGINLTKKGDRQMNWKLKILHGRTISNQATKTICIETENGSKIALLEGDREKNAKVILKSVNSHDELVETLDIALAALRSASMSGVLTKTELCSISIIEQALAKAKVE